MECYCQLPFAAGLCKIADGRLFGFSQRLTDRIGMEIISRTTVGTRDSLSKVSECRCLELANL